MTIREILAERLVGKVIRYKPIDVEVTFRVLKVNDLQQERDRHDSYDDGTTIFGLFVEMICDDKDGYETCIDIEFDDRFEIVD